MYCSVYPHTCHSWLWAFLVKLSINSHAYIILLNLPSFSLRPLNHLFDSISLYTEILHKVVLHLSPSSVLYVQRNTENSSYTQPQANPIISFFSEIINASSVLRNPCSLFSFPDIMSRLCLSSKTTCSNFLSFRCLFSNPLNHLQAFLWGQLVYSSLYVRYNAPTMHFIIFLRDGFSVCTWVIPQRTLNTVVIQSDGFTHPL